MKRTLVPAPYWLVHGLVQRQITQVHLPVDIERLEVEVPAPVYGDSPFASPVAKDGVSGRVRVQLNQHGAVSVIRPSLGLRPGEFHFVCPFVDGGETVLRASRRDGTWHIDGGAGQIAFTETWAVAGYRSADGPEPSREELVAQAPREAVVYASNHHGRETPPWGRSRWFGRAHMPMEYVRLHAVIRSVKLRRFDTLTPADVAESQALSLDRTPKDDVAAFARRWGNQHGRITGAPRWVWTLHIASVDDPSLRGRS